MSIPAGLLSEWVASGETGSLPADALSDTEIRVELREVRRQIARMEARSAELTAEAGRRGVPEAQGFGSLTAWLIAETGDPPAVCRSRVRVALALRHMPLTRQAFAVGELSEPRVRVLADLRGAAPGLFARDEGLLVSQARRLSARVFPLALSHWRKLADPDGAEAHAVRLFGCRRLHVSATWGGLVGVDGDLDPEGGAVVLAALRSLAEPSGPDPEDLRSPEQRRADALVEICRRHIDCGDFPDQGGHKPHLTLTVSLADLRGDGVQDLETGPVTAEAVRRLACDAHVSRVVLRGGSEPLEVGRRTRVVPAALRRALSLRDGGCTHPGCDVPARWCDAHHRVHWAAGGDTNLANLRLLCRRHHRAAHDHLRHPRRE